MSDAQRAVARLPAALCSAPPAPAPLRRGSPSEIAPRVPRSPLSGVREPLTRHSTEPYSRRVIGPRGDLGPHYGRATRVLRLPRRVCHLFHRQVPGARTPTIAATRLPWKAPERHRVLQILSDVEARDSLSVAHLQILPSGTGHRLHRYGFGAAARGTTVRPCAPPDNAGRMACIPSSRGRRVRFTRCENGAV